MIKVLRKTFDILEYISKRHGDSVLPSEVAEACDINQSTSVRLMKDLLEMGYLEQISRQKGYILGPTAYSLTQNNEYKQNFLDQAKEPAMEFAKKWSLSVILVTLHQAKRYILFHSDEINKYIRITQPYYLDVYSTCTGRLLLAFASEKEKKAVIDFYGFPAWDDIASESEMDQALVDLKSEAYLSLPHGPLGLINAAMPIFKDENVIGALGYSADKDHYSKTKWQSIKMDAKRTIKKINTLLLDNKINNEVF